MSGKEILNELYTEKLAATGVLTGVKNLIKPTATRIGKALGKGTLNVGNKLIKSNNKTIKNVGSKIGAKGVEMFQNPVQTTKRLATNAGLIAGGAVLDRAITQRRNNKIAHDLLNELVLEKIAKDDDIGKYETKFFKDRFVPALRDNLLAGGIGSAIGGSAGGLISKNPAVLVPAGLLGGLAGSSISKARNLSKLHKKEFGTKPSRSDYAKAIGTQALGVVPGVGIIAPFINTPEAIVKHKKRKQIQKRLNELEEQQQ